MNAWLVQDALTLVNKSLLVSAVSVAAITDFRTQTIPNWLTYPTLVLAMVLAAAQSLFTWWKANELTVLKSVICVELATEHSASATVISDAQSTYRALGFSDCLLGAAVLFCVMGSMWLFNTTGGGDVKLAMGMGAILGWQLGLSALIWTYLSAGCIVVVMMCYRHAAARVSGLCFARLSRRVPSRRVPHYSRHEIRVCQKQIAMGPYFAVATILVLGGGALL